MTSTSLPRDASTSPSSLLRDLPKQQEAERASLCWGNLMLESMSLGRSSTVTASGQSVEGRNGMTPRAGVAALLVLFHLLCLLEKGCVRAPPVPIPALQEQAALFNLLPGIDPPLDKLPSSLSEHVAREELVRQLRVSESWSDFRRALKILQLNAADDRDVGDRGGASKVVEGIQLLVEFIAKHPAEPEGYHALSRALLSLGRPGTAMADYIADAERAMAAWKRLNSELRGRHGHGGGGGGWASAPPSGEGGGRARIPERLERYARLHADTLEAGWSGKGLEGSGARFLVCQPSFGLGNRINAIMMCAAAAIATRRALLVHWNCFLCHDQIAYPISLQEVFGPPLIDWRVDHLSKLYDSEGEVRKGYAGLQESTEERPQFDLGHYLSTSQLDDTAGKPIIVVNCFRFHPAVLDNIHHASLFREIMGTTTSQGGEKGGWYSSVGQHLTGGPPMWARGPISRIRKLLHWFEKASPLPEDAPPTAGEASASAAERSGERRGGDWAGQQRQTQSAGRDDDGRGYEGGEELSRRHVAGLQLRFSLPDGYDGPSGTESEIDAFLSCALGTSDSQVRSLLLSCDSESKRAIVVEGLSKALGCIERAHGAIEQLKLNTGRSHNLWCHGYNRVGEDEDGDDFEMMQGIPAWAKPILLDFRSEGGARVRAVMFGGDLSRYTRQGALQSVLEMWALSSLPDHLVITEQSSFVLPASAMFPRSSTVAFAQLPNGTSTCYRLESAEPSCAHKAGRWGCSTPLEPDS